MKRIILLFLLSGPVMADVFYGKPTATLTWDYPYPDAVLSGFRAYCQSSNCAWSEVAVIPDPTARTAIVSNCGWASSTWGTAAFELRAYRDDGVGGLPAALSDPSPAISNGSFSNPNCMKPPSAPTGVTVK